MVRRQNEQRAPTSDAVRTPNPETGPGGALGRRTDGPDDGLASRRAGVARQQLDDLLTYTSELEALLDEHLGGDALTFADHAQQDVLGADVVVAELHRLTQ